MLVANDHFSQMNSAQEAPEKVVKNTEKGLPVKLAGQPVGLGRGHRFFLTLRTDRRRAILWTA